MLSISSAFPFESLPGNSGKQLPLVLMLKLKRSTIQSQINTNVKRHMREIVGN